MILLSPVIERLRGIKNAAGGKLAHLVEGSIAYAAATKAGAALGDGPNFYVLPLGDLPEPAKAEGGPQVVMSQFQVQVFQRLHGSVQGFTKEAELVDLENRILGSLLGWRPETWLGPLSLARAGLSDFKDQELWWGMAFQTRYLLQPKS
ncbi:MAG: hypothetical protein HY055_18075 [Magnetospirillum sp.]|nr:hypothetical protein [Magnetospirillum sp.]